MSTPHDARHDIATELRCVAELLADYGLHVQAVHCLADARRVLIGELSINRGIKRLCHFENLIGGNK